MQAIPRNSKRIILINPTKYLGNFLIAGGLIQNFHQYCIEQNIELLIVVDESFKPLIAPTLPAKSLIYYPRSAIKKAGKLKKATLYLNCLKKIRHFKADLAFVIEEDTVAHRLIQLSKAKFKLGCNIDRHKSGYHHVLNINFQQREQSEKHCWFGYKEIFQALGLKKKQPGYLKLKPAPTTVSQQTTFDTLGINNKYPTIVIHAGATKAYKKWPVEYFIELGQLLIQAKMQPVLIGAGKEDQQTNLRIKSALENVSPDLACVDLCDLMSLSQLVSFLSNAQAIIGNDSGPFHLASALHVPGCTIFGPTEIELWGPISECSKVIQGEQVCVPECRQPVCLFEHQCLKSVSPQQVFQTLTNLL